MSLESLPTELLLQIVSDLRPVELEKLAKTLNRTLYDICIPFLGKRIAQHRNARRMRERFCGKKRASRGERINLDYLDLNGDFHWLQPIREDEINHASGSPTAEVDLQRLQEQAKRLNITLPPEFVRFMGDVDLQSLIPIIYQEEFELGPSMLKCMSSVDSGGGGYLIKFHRDDQVVSYLYVEPGEVGAHCVITSGWDMHASGSFLPLKADESVTQEEIDLAKEEGVVISPLLKEDMYFEVSSFEDFIANMYYFVHLWYCQPPEYEGVRPKVLEEYVANLEAQGISERAIT